jgi:hypothetical protein
MGRACGRHGGGEMFNFVSMVVLKLSVTSFKRKPINMPDGFEV